MAQISLDWVGQRRFVGVDSTNHSVVLSPPGDIGVKPSDGLLIALGACAAFDLVEIVEKQRLQLDRLQLTVSGEQAESAPWAYTRIHLQVTARAEGLRVEQLRRAVDLSLNKYCSVRASLHPDIAVSFAVTVE